MSVEFVVTRGRGSWSIVTARGGELTGFGLRRPVGEVGLLDAEDCCLVYFDAGCGPAAQV